MSTHQSQWQAMTCHVVSMQVNPVMLAQKLVFQLSVKKKYLLPHHKRFVHERGKKNIHKKQNDRTVLIGWDNTSILWRHCVCCCENLLHRLHVLTSPSVLPLQPRAALLPLSLPAFDIIPLAPPHQSVIGDFLSSNSSRHRSRRPFFILFCFALVGKPAYGGDDERGWDSSSPHVVSTFSFIE